MSKWPFKILVKFPSRERPERFFKTMDTMYALASQPDYIGVLASFDTNDVWGMANPEVFNKLHGKYKNFTWVYGESESKIHAVNRDLDKIGEWLPEFKDWTILVNLSDDMLFNIFGWDDLIRIDMNQLAPDFDLLLHYLDVDTKGALATMYIAGRKFFERFNYIYHPSYKSVFADNEIEECAKLLGKWHYTGYSIYTHLNPAYGHLPRDPLFDFQQSQWNVDEINYNERKAKNFDLKL